MSDPNGNGDVPNELQDEKGRAKIGVAIAVIGTVVGVTIGSAAGVISATNEVAKAIIPLFYVLAGAVVGFWFGSKTKA